MALNLQENELKPYQSHFLLQSKTALTKKTLLRLLNELPSILDQGIKDNDDKCEILKKSSPRSFNGEQIGWVVYRQAIPVRWVSIPNTLRDIEHNLVVLTARGGVLSVVASDKTLGMKLSRRIASHTGAWSALKRVPAQLLENTLVQGVTRTLWLSGIHRSVATKPDSKVLIGPDIEASLDALGDQSYEYTATRCEAPAGLLPAAFVGVTPRSAKVWLGPSHSWEVFVANSAALLELVGTSPRRRDHPYPILAHAESSLLAAHDAFDVSLAPPETLYEEDPQLISKLEELIETVRWTVKPSGHGPNFVLTLQVADTAHRLKVELKSVADEIVHTVEPIAKDPPKEIEKIAELFRRTDLLKVFYDSLHTYSNGQLFEVKTRSIPFHFKAGDFRNFDVALEKPRKAGKRGQSDLTRIGEAKEPSLFSWIWRNYQNGWLWCDDGSGEIADFIHLDSTRTVLSLIHAKAANSDSSSRPISVSAYEVVCSQALKNLRYTERRDLEAPLREKLEAETKLVRGWQNGVELASGSTKFWSAVSSARYSSLKRRVVILQPHVRISALPPDLSKDTREVRQARLLYTLLDGIKADVNRYGVELEVIADGTKLARR